jgi:hypothetical protein
MRASVFYVYVAFRPWDGSPCYVGKGKGNRWRRHFRTSPNRNLANIIKKAGGTIPTVVIRRGLFEEEAFEIERAFIKAIGRKAHGGPLVNLTDGGDGPSGARHSDEVKRARSKDLKAAWGRPGARERGSLAASKVWAERTSEQRLEWSRRSSLNASDQWKNKERVARLSEKAKLRWSNPNFREKCAEAQKQRWAAMSQQERDSIRSSLSLGQQRRRVREMRQ